jgi:O-Antigen ligase
MRTARELMSPLTLALVLVGAALFFAHDPGDSSIPWLGIGALVLLGVLFATRAPPEGLVAFVPLAALAVWCAVSISWSIEPDRSWSYANRTFVYLGFALVGAFLGAEPRRLLYGFCGLLGAMCVWSLAGKVLPWLYEDYGRLARLRAPVGYWNALALLGDIALPLGLCLATRLRWAGTLLVYGWIVVIGLTYSRGGVLVAVVVVGLWMLLSKAAIEALSTVVAAGLPAAAALAVAFSLPGLTSDGQSHTARVHAGIVFGIVLVADALIAVGLARFPLPVVTTTRRIALAVLAVAIAASVAVGAAHAHSWWRSFTAPSGTELTNSPGHLVSSGGNFRWSWWQQAWTGFEHNPVKGTGAGTFEGTNLRYRTTSLDQTIEPHDLPLQFLTETGVIGLALFGASVAWLLVRGRRRPGPQLALALALPAYFLHGLLDVDWDFASVSAPVFLIAGALVVKPPSGGRRPRGFPVLTASGVLLAVGFSLVAVWLGARWSDQAAADVGVNDNHAVTLAQRARTLNPLSLDPLFQAAAAEVDIGAGIKRAHDKGWLARYKAVNHLAYGFYNKATEIQPENANAWFQLGYFQLATRGCPRAALRAFNRATVFDGRNPIYNDYYANALTRVNSGKPRC